MHTSGKFNTHRLTRWTILFPEDNLRSILLLQNSNDLNGYKSVAIKTYNPRDTINSTFVSCTTLRTLPDTVLPRRILPIDFGQFGPLGFVRAQ
jgi:hypothetical protein